jgi:hypothetical protein
MKNKFLLIFCSAALLTVMNTSYAASLPTSRGRSQVGSKLAGGGKLCNGKLPGIYGNYMARYAIGYSMDRRPVLAIYSTGGDQGRGIVEAVFVNGRSILGRFRGGEVNIQEYQFKGDDREYRIKSGDRVKVIFSRLYGKDWIECTVPSKEAD